MTCTPRAPPLRPPPAPPPHSHVEALLAVWRISRRPPRPRVAPFVLACAGAVRRAAGGRCWSVGGGRPDTPPKVVVPGLAGSAVSGGDRAGRRRACGQLLVCSCGANTGRRTQQDHVVGGVEWGREWSDQWSGVEPCGGSRVAPRALGPTSRAAPARWTCALGGGRVAAASSESFCCWRAASQPPPPPGPRPGPQGRRPTPYITRRGSGITRRARHPGSPGRAAPRRLRATQHPRRWTGRGCRPWWPGRRTPPGSRRRTPA